MGFFDKFKKRENIKSNIEEKSQNLVLLAKNTSTELYEKYKNIDEYNWNEYI